MSFGTNVLNAPLRDFREAAKVYYVDTYEHERQLEEIEVLLLPFLCALVVEDATQGVDVEVALACGFRLNLEATESIVGGNFVVDGVIYHGADIAQVLAGHSVKEVYAVRRIYEGTGIHTRFLVIRWRTLANPGPLLVAFNDAFEDYSVVSGTRSLFRCFAELGVSPIPVPRKASHESSTGS